MRSIHAAMTLLSGGSAEDETSSSRAITSHATASSRRGEYRMKAFMPSRHPLLLRLDGFLAHQIPDLVHLVDEGGRAEHVRVLGEFRVDHRLDAAGTRRHHEHAL